jgi:UDP-2,3-diacylglucosamine pyrophosphatase LpxH
MSKKVKREIEILVISDVHLGTFGCRAKELLSYMKTVDPKILILNGDIIDIWQFNKRYFPKSHMKVIKYITSMLVKGTKVYYITGNHDEMLRKFKGFKLGGFEIVNKLVLQLDGNKTWFFHGDVFDITMKYSKWLARLGGKGYDILILINTVINWMSLKMGLGRLSFSKRIKNSVKGAVKYVNNFEATVAEIASLHHYKYAVCGHIHQPQIREIKDRSGNKVTYLNSGDWIENLSALEYDKGKWSLYIFQEDPVAQKDVILDEESANEYELNRAAYKNKQLFDDLVEEFQFNRLLKGYKE